MDKNIISIINSTSAISALDDDHLKKVAGYILWKYKSSQMSQSTGIVLASSKQIGDEVGLTPKAVFAVSKQLEEKNFFKFLPWFEGCGRKTSEYHINAERFGLVDSAKKADEILSNFDYFKRYTEEVFKQVDCDGENFLTKCYHNWAKPFTTQEQQTAASKMMLILFSKLRALGDNADKGSIEELLANTRKMLIDVCDRVWLSSAVKEYVGRMYLGMVEMTKGIDYPIIEQAPIKPTILTPANTIKEEDLTPESALKMLEENIASIAASSASQSQKGELMNSIARHMVKINKERWQVDDFAPNVWKIWTRYWMKVLNPLGIINKPDSPAPSTKVDEVDEKLFRKIVEEEGGEVIR